MTDTKRQIKPSLTEEERGEKIKKAWWWWWWGGWGGRKSGEETKWSVFSSNMGSQ